MYAQEAGRDPSMLKVYVRVNGLITTSPMPENRRPFLGGSPDQIAHDLDRVRKLDVAIARVRHSVLDAKVWFSNWEVVVTMISSPCTF